MPRVCCRPGCACSTRGSSTPESLAKSFAACLRVVDPGLKYAEPSIGRVITAPGWRGLGGGRVLMRQGLAQCNQLWPDQAVRISAQAHLQRFYASLGFDPVGDPYLEDGIPHVEMMRVPPVRA